MTDLSQRLPATALLVCIAFAASQAAAQNEASPEPTSTVDTAEAATEGKTEPNAASSTTADSPADPSEARDDAERPPLSTYDRMLQDNNEPIPEERSLTEQLIRTVFALGIVVALIYLIFKLGLGRLLQGGGVPGFSSRSSREIRVLERTAIDAKNAVYLLELSAKRRILIGAGERGVNYLCEVDVSAEPEAGREAETGTGTGAKSDPGTTLNEAPQETSSGQSFGEVLEGYPKTRKPS